MLKSFSRSLLEEDFVSLLREATFRRLLEHSIAATMDTSEDGGQKPAKTLDLHVSPPYSEGDDIAAGLQCWLCRGKKGQKRFTEWGKLLQHVKCVHFENNISPLQGSYLFVAGQKDWYVKYSQKVKPTVKAKADPVVKARGGKGESVVKAKAEPVAKARAVKKGVVLKAKAGPVAKARGGKGDSEVKAKAEPVVKARAVKKETVVKAKADPVVKVETGKKDVVVKVEMDSAVKAEAGKKDIMVEAAAVTTEPEHPVDLKKNIVTFGGCCWIPCFAKVSPEGELPEGPAVLMPVDLKSTASGLKKPKWA